MKQLGILTVVALCMSCSSGSGTSSSPLAVFGRKVSQVTGLAALAAEGHEKMNATEYIEWFEGGDHGLIAEKEIAGYKYSALYKPAAYEILKMYPDPHARSAELKVLPELQYYTLRIEKKDFSNELLKDGVRDEVQYGQRVAYFSYQVQQDIQLYDGEDTLSCAMSHYERTYGVSPGLTLLLAFPVKANERTNTPVYQSKTIAFNDQVFGNGKVLLTIGADKLNRMPELALND